MKHILRVASVVTNKTRVQYLKMSKGPVNSLELKLIFICILRMIAFITDSKICTLFSVQNRSLIFLWKSKTKKTRGEIANHDESKQSHKNKKEQQQQQNRIKIEDWKICKSIDLAADFKIYLSVYPLYLKTNKSFVYCMRGLP